MTCTETREALGAYADGEARDEEARALEGHLEGCAACRTALAALRAMKASVASLAGPPLPAGLEASLLREARSAARDRRLPRRLPVPAWAGGLTLALAAAALVVGLREPADEVLSLDAMLSAHAGYAESLGASEDSDEEEALLDELDWPGGGESDEL